MFNIPWSVELSENIQNLQMDQVEDKKEFLDIYWSLLSNHAFAMLLSTILSWPSKTKEALKFSPLLKYLNKIKTILGYLSM